MTRRARIIYNPAAGPWDVIRGLLRLAGYLDNAGFATELVQTHIPGDAKRFSEQASQDGVDLVLLAGGDGTINEAANGLVNSSSVLGIVPVGTGNVLAHQLGMPILTPVAPYHARDVADAFINGRIQRVDMGQVNQRYFVCWAGAGLDAEISAQMEPRPRFTKRFRALPYIITGFSVASEYRGVPMRITIEEGSFRARALVVISSNIQLYGAYMKIAPLACMDDGKLDIFVFKGLGFSYMLRHLARFFSGHHLDNPELTHVVSRKLRIETSPNVAVQLDGDPYGTTPVELTMIPGALRLLVPPSAPDSLFSKSPESW